MVFARFTTNQMEKVNLDLDATHSQMKKCSLRGPQSIAAQRAHVTNGVAMHETKWRLIFVIQAEAAQNQA
jgi:hypothetical protein